MSCDEPWNINAAALCRSKQQSTLAELCQVYQHRTKTNYLWLISVSPQTYKSSCEVSLLLNENAISLISKVQINLLQRQDQPCMSTGSISPLKSLFLRPHWRELQLIYILLNREYRGGLSWNASIGRKDIYPCIVPDLVTREYSGLNSKPKIQSGHVWYIMSCCTICHGGELQHHW